MNTQPNCALASLTGFLSSKGCRERAVKKKEFLLLINVCLDNYCQANEVISQAMILLAKVCEDVRMDSLRTHLLDGND